MWYGAATSAKGAMRKHHAQQWERSAGGKRSDTAWQRSTSPNTTGAVYGSTDAAKADHRNDKMCKVAPDSTGTRNGAPYCPNFTTIQYESDYFSETTTLQECIETGTLPDPEVLIRRAIARGMTVVQYAAMIGVQL